MRRGQGGSAPPTAAQRLQRPTQLARPATRRRLLAAFQFNSLNDAIVALGEPPISGFFNETSSV